MKHRLLASMLALMLVLVIATGTAWSMSSASYSILFDSFMGGGSGGGGVSTSAGYRMEGSFGSAIHMYDTSSGFQLCSGFICLWIPSKLFLPLTLK